jgi:hypothetical protein
MFGVVSWGAETRSFSRITIVPGERATPVEQKAAELLKERMLHHGAAEARIARSQVQLGNENERDELVVYLGVPERHDQLAALCRNERVPLPDRKDPGAEGFILWSMNTDNPVLLAAGVDERGVLYAVGEILRRCVDRGTSFEFPISVDIRTAPPFRYRGTEVSQGATITQLTGSRQWTDAEWQQVVLDYVLAGANTFGVGHVSPTGFSQFDFIKSYGLNTLISIGPNTGSGPPEWQATEAINRKGYLCLSIPEARQSILDMWEKNAQAGFTHDIARFYSGDGGGCECERCAPYGKKYIEMCEDIAKIILKYNPNVTFFATNQKLDNASDQAIFDYLNAAPRPWLTSLCYGPGSNAMGWQPGRRQDHRMDLFEYPAFGPTDRYVREIVHQLPPSQSLVFFTDLTHWVYSEYGLVHIMLGPDRNGDVPPHWGGWVYEQHPDLAMYQVYDRRTFHARPRRYYDTFQETERYGEGDVTYSEGHHDQFNQWMWQRLLWNPHMSLEEVLDEYARTWFGPEAAPLMAQALLQLEQNLSTPIADNNGIDRYYSLVKEADTKMPEWNMKRNYLWRQHMQRAALDRYIQLRVREQMRQKEEVEALINAYLQKHDLAVIAKCRERLYAEVETDEMKALKAEAARLGEESDALFGVRNEGFFNLDQDFVGLGWMRKQFGESALSSVTPFPEKPLAQIVHYEDPGPGGFYDDAGDPARSPHLVYGWAFSDDDVSPSNRPSQRTMAYTRDEKQGVTFAYADLDPKASYSVRFTFVRPRYEARYAEKQPQKTQSIYANDGLLAKDVELPEWEAGFFEYDIPEEATRDGKLQIRLEKSAGIGEGSPSQVEVWRNTGGWGTLVSEVWLVRKP